MIVSGTNRTRSNTLKVCGIYKQLLSEKGYKAHIFDLRFLPADIAFYEHKGKNSKEFTELLDRYVRPFRRFFFVVPEYNGSFPGILKVFLDLTHPREWNNRLACLVGVAEGRAGNLRGLEHLTGILHYMQMHVYHYKLPISSISSNMDDSGNFIHGIQLDACKQQKKGF